MITTCGGTDVERVESCGDGREGERELWRRIEGDKAVEKERELWTMRESNREVGRAVEKERELWIRRGSCGEG